MLCLFFCIENLPTRLFSTYGNIFILLTFILCFFVYNFCLINFWFLFDFWRLIVTYEEITCLSHPLMIITTCSEVAHVFLHVVRRILLVLVCAVMLTLVCFFSMDSIPIFVPPRGSGDYMCRLGSLGNSSTASGSISVLGWRLAPAIDRPSRLIFFVPVVLLFIFFVHFFPFSSSSYFILAVLMRQCLENTRARVPHFIQLCWIKPALFAL